MSTTSEQGLPPVSASLETSPLAPSETQTSSYRQSNVVFSGKGGEFFGIWIVNILLTIITLGIYSAWAKVRTQQYFFGHTKVDGHAFRYLATPIQILKGRLLAFAVIAIFSVSSHFSPLFGLVFAIAAIFVMPWLLIQGIKFNLRMTAYRNVRFGFHGSYGGAFLNFIFFPILAVFTLYLLMPYVLKRMDKFIYENVSYGGQKLTTRITTGTYYEACVKAFFASLGAIIVLMVTLGILSLIFGLNMSFGDTQISAGLSSDTGEYSIGGILSGILATSVYIFGYVLIIALSQAIYRSIIRNHLFESTEFEDLATFKSTTQIGDYCVLLATNYVMIICSLGLAYPITKVRTAAYLASVTEVTVNTKIDSLTDPLNQDSSTFLQEAADLYDIDFSLT